MKKLIVLLLVFALVLSACQNSENVLGEESPLSPNTPKSEETNAEITRKYQSKAVFFKLDDGTVKAVLENGKAIEIKSPDSSYISTGCTADNLTVNVYENGVESADNIYPYTERNNRVNSEYKNAPNTYAKMLLDNLICNGNIDAIWDYKLHNVEVKSTQGEGRIDFVMTYDITIARQSTAYKEYSPFSGEYGKGFELKNQSKEVTIFGTDGQWSAYDYVNFGDLQEPKKLRSEYLTPAENQTILFETEKYTYYYEKEYLPQAEEDRKNEVPVEYQSSLYSLNHESGEKTELFKEERNTDVFFVDYYNGKLYFGLEYWIPYSESFSAGTMCLDEETQKVVTYLRKIDSITKDTMYYIEDRINLEPILWSFDMNSCVEKKICELPMTSRYFDVVNVLGGKMKIDCYEENPPKILEVDLKSGKATSLK